MMVRWIAVIRISNIIIDRCDGEVDCKDGTDEFGCEKFAHYKQHLDPEMKKKRFRQIYGKEPPLGWALWSLYAN